MNTDVEREAVEGVAGGRERKSGTVGLRKERKRGRDREAKR
jgi:hypothetical protein